MLRLGSDIFNYDPSRLGLPMLERYQHEKQLGLVEGVIFVKEWDLPTVKVFSSVLISIIMSRIDSVGSALDRAPNEGSLIEGRS